MHNPQEDELIQQIASYCNITEQHDRVLPYVTITLEKAACPIPMPADRLRFNEWLVICLDVLNNPATLKMVLQEYDLLVQFHIWVNTINFAAMDSKSIACPAVCRTWRARPNKIELFVVVE